MRIRVVQIITKIELGGAQQITLHTCRYLDRRRFEVVLVTGNEGELLEEARAILDCPVHLVPDLVREVSPVRDFRALLALWRILARERREAPGPVIVNSHSSKAGILGRAAARLAGIPVVVHSIHGYGFHSGQHPAVRHFYIALERLAARWTDAFFADADESRRTGVRLGLFTPERCEVMRCPIEVDLYRRPPEARSSARAALGVPPDVPLVGMVACLKPQKAPEDFVAVAARVREALPEARFFLAGDGERRESVEAAVRAAGLGDAFKLLGWRRDVPELMAALDVLVLTSRWEGLPLVFPQAMAAGRPIVATNVNGSPEVVEEGVTGHLVPPGDAAGLADRVIALLRAPSRREQMGRAASAAVRRFEAVEVVRRQEAVFERLVAALPATQRRFLPASGRLSS